MMRIGDKEVVHQTSLIVPDGEVASFRVGLTTPLTVEVQFHPDSKSETRVAWKFGDGTLHIDFNGMQGSLGVVPKEPLKLGSIGDNEAIGFLFYHHRVGNMNRLDFLFLKGGTYE
jgi:hypothetical protein